MDDSPRFCEKCPMIPDGVVAALTGAEVITMTSLKRYRFAHLQPEAAEKFVGETRLKAIVVESTAPNVDKGDTARMIVPADGKDFKELKPLVANCMGPMSVNVLQRLFRVKTRCGVFDNKYVTSE